MSTDYKSFETERLIINPTSTADSSFIFELLNTPKWNKYIGNRNINSIKDAEDYIQKKMIPQLEKLGFSNYTVIRKSDGAKLGTCGLYDREGLDGVDIGFAFLPQFEGQGYAFESVAKLRDAAFKNFQLSGLNAITLEENVDSQKLLRKLGFHFEKTIRIPNDSEELLLFKLSNES